MNRKILEDVKFNKVRDIPKKHIGDVVVKKVVDRGAEAKIADNSHIYQNHPNQSSDKYDFLKNRKSVSTGAQRISKTPHLPAKKRSIRGWFVFLFIVSLIIGAVYLLSTVFLNAKITLVPKNKVFELKKQAFVAGEEDSNIQFELMIVSDKEYKDMVLTSSLEASDKAKGEITLYNEYSKLPQKIVAGSFISDENGKTYKIDKAITIPGYTLDQSSIVVPGEVTANITAFLAGETYNGSPSDFYVSSFKGTQKYIKIYGKLKTPLTGGMVGLVYLMDEQGKNDLESSDVSKLQDRLMRKLSAQVPDGYILYPNAVKFAYDFNENIVSKNPNIKAEINGSLSAFLLKDNSLSNSIINKLLPDIDKKERSEIQKPNISNLSFNFENADQLVAKDIKNFNFNLTGNVSVDWVPNTEELKVLLSGKNKNSVNPIFKNDPGISSAYVSIMPFWISILPDDIKNINIVLKNLTKN